MSFQSIDYLLQQAEETQDENIPKKSSKIDLRTPFGLNDLMFDDNELYSCDQNISSSMSLLNLDSQMTNECPNISDYISKQLSLLTTEGPTCLNTESNKNNENNEIQIPAIDKNNLNCENNDKYIDKIISKKQLLQNSKIKKYKIFRTKSLAKVQKSPLEKADTGLGFIMGRKYPKSTSNLMNNYLYNVLVKTRSRGFKFNTPSPDESVLSWMDIVRQMPSK